MTDSLWNLDPDAPEWLHSIITRLLRVGVPPTAISLAFDVEVHAIKELQSELLVRRYGTSEITEAMSFLIWRAYDDALQILNHAPIQHRTRFITTLLSRASALVGKQSPEEFDRLRSEMEKLISSVQADQSLEPSIYASPEFSPLDRESDDPEEGFES